MKKNIIVIGMGELGSVFARGFLKLGFPVQGVTRDMDMTQMANSYPCPEAVLIAVGEADLHATLLTIPEPWQDKIILIQNELLPKDWQSIRLPDPTVISVWFEKKKGMDSKQVVPSPVYGRHSELVKNALKTLDLDCYQVESETDLTFELVRKNLYILTTNIAGLETGGDVSHLKTNHANIMDNVAKDILKLQNTLTKQENDFDTLKAAMLSAFEGDLQHKCMGRSAPARLKRALSIAAEKALSLPTLESIAEKHLH